MLLIAFAHRTVRMSHVHMCQCTHVSMYMCQCTAHTAAYEQSLSDGVVRLVEVKDPRQCTRSAFMGFNVEAPHREGSRGRINNPVYVTHTASELRATCSLPLSSFVRFLYASRGNSINVFILY